MRFSIFLFLLFATSCFSQQTKEQPSKTDTLKLFDPKPEPPSPGDTLMFKNSIVLFRPDYTIIYNGTENTFTDIKSLSAHLQKMSALLRRRKFYILTDSNTKADKIVSVLDLLQTHKIENFKLINYQEYFKPPTPVTYQAPTETVTISKLYDCSYLLIKIAEDSFETTLRNKKQTTKNHSEVEQFIIANKSMIDPDKIVIFANANASYDKFKPILDILKKQEYYKFKMVSQ